MVLKGNRYFLLRIYFTLTIYDSCNLSYVFVREHYEVGKTYCCSGEVNVNAGYYMGGGKVIFEPLKKFLSPGGIWQKVLVP